jgi:hypothetical protein
MVFNGYGATTNENQSRLISGAVTGLFLDGDDLTTADGQAAAQMCLTNAAINRIASVGRTFTPVEGNTGSNASGIFVRQENASAWSIAVFNYTTGPTNESVDLSRAGLPATNFLATDLWAGTTSTVSGSFTVGLNPKQARLIRLSLMTPATSPVIGSVAMSGGNLVFSGVGGVPAGTFYVLTSTNLQLPLANWTLTTTGQFDGAGDFSVTNLVNQDSPQQFYLLKMQNTD